MMTEVVVGVLEFVEAVNFHGKAPIPLLFGFANHLTVVGSRAFEEFKEPVPHAKTGTIFILIEIVGGSEYLTDKGLRIGAVFLWQGCHMTIRELFDPIGQLVVSIGTRDHKVWGAAISIE